MVITTTDFRVHGYNDYGFSGRIVKITSCFAERPVYRRSARRSARLLGYMTLCDIRDMRVTVASYLAQENCVRQLIRSS